MPYVYKIVNDINNKCYIGQTSTSIETRWKWHCYEYTRECEKQRPLYAAMNKYGIENFHIEEIEECELSNRFEREIFWIETLGTFKDGYNETMGGGGKRYIDRKMVFDLYNKYRNSITVAKIMGISQDSVQTILNEYNVNLLQLSSTKYGVVMLDKKTNQPIKVFASCAEASRWLNDTGECRCKENKGRSHISAVCNGKRKTAFGYKWEKTTPPPIVAS